MRSPIVSVDIVLGCAYPPYEGGPLPPWMRDAGFAFADRGRACVQMIREQLGPIEGIAGEWRSTGSDPNLPFDDWRVTVRCANGTGTIRLAFAAKPAKSLVVIHGTKSSRRIDPFSRLHRLFEHLGEPDDPQIALATDEIARQASADHRAQLAKFTLGERVPFLVTGATGNVGRAMVARLVGLGHRVRVMVRKIPSKPHANVEYCFGNLGDPAAVERAVKGAAIVIHIGAATKGGWDEHRVGTVVGTENVIAACTKHRVSQLVYLSSMSVLDWAGLADNGPVTETAPFEPRPEERGPYTRAKLEGEKLVVAAAKAGLPVVILRPGQIFGGGIPLINGAVARDAAGRWLVLGDGTLELPLVYVDDVIDAILAAVDKKLVAGEVIQIIDPVHLTQRDVLDLAGGGKPVIAVPRPIVFALGTLSEIPLRLVGRRSPIAAYRLRSALARLHYESDRAHGLLGWSPRVGVREGIRLI